MKKIILLIAAVAFSHISAFSQGCLPEGIEFNSQEQIDNFQINYPDCNEITGDVFIHGSEIINLNGLNVVTSIGGDLWILGNEVLTNLTGLDSLTSIGGDLIIKTNFILTSLAGLEGLTSIGGGLNIGGLDWEGNDSLTSLLGFTNLTFIGGGISISNNDALTNLVGLENLSSIGGGIGIVSNDNLANLTGLEGLTSIGGEIMIYFNNSLVSLKGLDNVTSVGGSIFISINTALISLSGLDNIGAGSITALEISDNTSLSTCDVQSICDYVAAPNGTMDIFENAPGCNSPEEVQEACLTSLKDLGSVNEVSIFPNPGNNLLFISTPNNETIDETVIYNHTGQKVQQGKPIYNTLDISKLQPGMYIVELVTDQGKVMEKLIIE
jgi:hypothetical protein